VKLLIDPRALAELDDAAEFYRNESGVALADAFVAEYERTLARALDTPAAGSLLRGRRRRFLFRRFPYSLVYHVAGDELRVVAVAHQSRRPNYWFRR
jgi:toxin ParE1/3/4